MRLPMMPAFAAFVVLAALPTPVARGPAPHRGRAVPKEAAMQITSTAFAHLAAIPKRHTCEGEDVSPPLAWSGVPAAAKSLALIVDDPDAPDPAAPKMNWVHWVIYDLPPAATGLPGGLARDDLPKGALEGLNDWHKPGWRGPCPPVGRHRYFHRLYALDVVLPDLQHPTRAALMKAMEGHVLATAELVGTYQSTH